LPNRNSRRPWKSPPKSFARTPLELATGRSTAQKKKKPEGPPEAFIFRNLSRRPIPEQIPVRAARPFIHWGMSTKKHSIRCARRETRQPLESRKPPRLDSLRFCAADIPGCTRKKMGTFIVTLRKARFRGARSQTTRNSPHGAWAGVYMQKKRDFPSAEKKPRPALPARPKTAEKQSRSGKISQLQRFTISAGNFRLSPRHPGPH